jgi:hypothetical protein
MSGMISYRLGDIISYLARLGLDDRETLLLIRVLMDERCRCVAAQIERKQAAAGARRPLRR